MATLALLFYFFGALFLIGGLTETATMPILADVVGGICIGIGSTLWVLWRLEQWCRQPGGPE